jgi:hypothetical protein
MDQAKPSPLPLAQNTQAGVFLPAIARLRTAVQIGGTARRASSSSSRWLQAVYDRHRAGPFPRREATRPPGRGRLLPPAACLTRLRIGSSARRAQYEAYRIDPRRNRVTSFIRLPPTPVVITVAYGRVWVDEPRVGPAVVFRIDPQTNRVSGPPIKVGTGGGWMVAGFGALWVTNGDSNGSVSRIDPATGTVTRTLANIPDITAAGAGSLWGTGNYGGVYRVDPATGRVTATIGPKNAVNVTFWAGSAWASAEPPGTLVRIDPASNRMAGTAAPAGTSPIYITGAPMGCGWSTSPPGTCCTSPPPPPSSNSRPRHAKPTTTRSTVRARGRSPC